MRVLKMADIGVFFNTFAAFLLHYSPLTTYVSHDERR